MSEREKLLRRLSAAQFAAWEMHVYLDTHPDNAEALASYKKYSRRADELTAEYEQKYGPLTTGDSLGSNSFDWINSPWPWETERVADE